MVSGRGTTASIGQTAASAKPPWASVAITRSPGAMPTTPGPQASIRPAISMPGTKGSAGFSW
jgi:hypothetical protein